MLKQVEKGDKNERNQLLMERNDPKRNQNDYTNRVDFLSLVTSPFCYSHDEDVTGSARKTEFVWNWKILEKKNEKKKSKKN